MKIDRSLRIFGFLSFFLAMAPFYPEPHLFGKIKWVLGGAEGMQQVDWLDLLMHGGPITFFLILFGISLGRRLLQKKTEVKIGSIKERSSHNKGIAA